MAALRRRHGITFDDSGKHRTMFCIVTGEMVDGTKVWTECDPERNLIDIEKQYYMETRNGWTEFIRF